MNVPVPAALVDGAAMAATATREPEPQAAAQLVGGQLRPKRPTEQDHPARTGGGRASREQGQATTSEDGRLIPATKSVRLHDLRHTAATLWLTAGVHFIQVAKWLGHSSYVLTADDLRRLHSRARS